MTIALTGGTGFVGQALLDVLEHQGRSARALARSVPKDRRTGVEWVGGSLSDRGSLKRLASDAEVVIHIAGLTSTTDPAEFEAANVTGTLELVEAAVAAGVPRFIFVSSLAAREPELSVYGASKARAEKVVAASGLDWTIVRPPGVYGPRDVDYFEMFRMAKVGVVPMPPEGRSSLIHVHDLAELLVALIPSSEDVTHCIFEPDDGREGGWTHRDVAKTIGWAVGRHPWVPHLSKGMLSLMARADRLARGRKARLTADRVGYMSHPDWVADPVRHVPEAIWKARIPTREGFKSTARWYRKKKWL